jgi:hypothetical protein
MRSAALRNWAVAEESSAGLRGGEQSAPQVMTSTSELLRRIGSRCVTVDASASSAPRCGQTTTTEVWII